MTNPKSTRIKSAVRNRGAKAPHTEANQLPLFDMHGNAQFQFALWVNELADDAGRFEIEEMRVRLLCKPPSAPNAVAAIMATVDVLRALHRSWDRTTHRGPAFRYPPLTMSTATCKTCVVTVRSDDCSDEIAITKFDAGTRIELLIPHPSGWWCSGLDWLGRNASCCAANTDRQVPWAPRTCGCKDLTLTAKRRRTLQREAEPN